MGNCCLPGSEEVRADAKQVAQCPSCGAAAKPVARITLMHQVVAPLNQKLPSDAFFFCSGAACKAVYFSEGGVVIDSSQVRWAVGQKSTDADRMICYCFGVTHSGVMEEIEQTGCSCSKTFVVEQTRLKNCACEIRNPSGKCCLREFP